MTTPETWTRADTADANARSTATPHLWRSRHAASMTRSVGGKMMRFVGGGQHAAAESEASLRAEHPALSEARTIFPKARRDPADFSHVLISGHNNAKTGAFVAKGPWRGMPIYTLSLEERATCPRSCDLWRSCMGNAMPYAARYAHGQPLVDALGRDLARLSGEHPQGFVVRLHVLGDFYSEAYAQFWQRAAAAHPRLHAWGYTHHAAASRIGRRLVWLNERHPDRFAFRFSVPSTEPIAPMQATTVWREIAMPVVPEGHVCPASTGATTSCGTCGLCWEPGMRGERIVFPGHGMKRRRAA